MKINLLIVDDHKLFREGIISLFDSNSIEIIGEAGNAIEAITAAKKLKPDIILMDIGMNGMNGIEATQIILDEVPETKVIGLSMYADKNYIREMLDAGAYGYILKNCSHEQLNNAIMTVAKGNKYLSDEITNIVISDYLSETHDPGPVKTVFSERETEVLKLYAEGKTTQEIAEILFISAKTVATHKQNIFKKTNMRSLADMIKYAIKNRLVNI
jgi:two-component system, NarL family, response regulator NreC